LTASISLNRVVSIVDHIDVSGAVHATPLGKLNPLPKMFIVGDDGILPFTARISLDLAVGFVGNVDIFRFRPMATPIGL